MENFSILKEDCNYFSMKPIQDTQVHEIGCLDMKIYKCISKEYVTDRVVITEKQLIHINGRHPEAYNSTVRYIESVLAQPDYIIEDKRPNTGLVIKKIAYGKRHMLLVLRICTCCDKGYKNSVITSWEIIEARLKNYLKNKQVLYRRE